jgi:hypothetical protein
MDSIGLVTEALPGILSFPLLVLERSDVLVVSLGDVLEGVADAAAVRVLSSDEIRKIV